MFISTNSQHSQQTISSQMIDISKLTLCKCGKLCYATLCCECYRNLLVDPDQFNFTACDLCLVRYKMTRKVTYRLGLHWTGGKLHNEDSPLGEAEAWGTFRCTAMQLDSLYYCNCNHICKAPTYNSYNYKGDDYLSCCECRPGFIVWWRFPNCSICEPRAKMRCA